MLTTPSTRGQTGSRFAQPKNVLFGHALALGLVRGTILQSAYGGAKYVRKTPQSGALRRHSFCWAIHFG